jgi:hypothetical protein
LPEAIAGDGLEVVCNLKRGRRNFLFESGVTH